MATDYYITLAVGRDASSEEIKKAFRRIAHQTHPDANPGDLEAEARFRAAAEAYEVLSDPERRRRYDRGDLLDISGLLAGVGMDEILRSVFGEGGLFGSAPSSASRGRDVAVRVEITLKEAAFGTEIPVGFRAQAGCRNCGGQGAEPGTEKQNCSECGGSGMVRRSRRSVFGPMTTVSTCVQCRGEGVVIASPCHVCAGVGAVPEEMLVSVEIPAGVSSGTRLRMSGRGDSVGRAGSPGDLFVEVLVAPDPVFERIDDDLLAKFKLGIAQAILGTKIEAPLLEGGAIEIEIPPGTQPGTNFIIPEKGVTRLGRHSRGDLYVTVDVEIPQSLTPEEEHLVQRWADLRGEKTDRPASTG